MDSIPPPREREKEHRKQASVLEGIASAAHRTTGADRAARFSAKYGPESTGAVFSQGLSLSRKPRKMDPLKLRGAGDGAAAAAMGVPVSGDEEGGSMLAYDNARSGLMAWSLSDLRDAFFSVYGRKSTSKNKEWLVRRLREQGYSADGEVDSGDADAATEEQQETGHHGAAAAAAAVEAALPCMAEETAI
jgi:hypothetical protein